MKKLALITGATSGLGLSYAAYFASQGYDLIVTGRRREALFSNGKKWREQYHVNVETILVELSDREEVRRLIKHVGDREIDMLVNNAGFGLKPVFADTSEEEMERILSLQVWCVTKLTHFVLQRMLRRNTGGIINISSDGAFAVLPHNVLYSSTKLYILNFTEGLHLELAGTGIQVQAVCPGFIDSHFHESAGMNVDKKKKGLFGFRQPDEIVRDAMKDWRKGKVVSVPDRGAKLIRALARVLPRTFFYRMAAGFSKSIAGKKSPQ